MGHSHGDGYCPAGGLVGLSLPPALPFGCGFGVSPPPVPLEDAGGGLGRDPLGGPCSVQTPVGPCPAGKLRSTVCGQ